MKIYTAAPADPESTPMQKQYRTGVALAIASNVKRYSVGALRIAHNSLYALANRLDDFDTAKLAFEARERLWSEILTRDRL